MRCFMSFKVNIHWDDQAEVWVAVCDELGIALESGSYDALIEKLKVTIPEMIELNGYTDVKVCLSTLDRQLAYA